MTIYKNVLNYVEKNGKIIKIEENVNDILLRKDNHYKGWKCWSGIHNLAISPDGKIFNASCRNELLGNIFIDENIELPNEPHICTREWCACAAHLNTKKVKNDKYKKYVREEETE